MADDPDLVWDSEAEREFRTFLSRRNDREGVALCVGLQLDALARHPSMATRWAGPRDYLIHRFQCQDGDTTLHDQVVLQEVSDGRLGVVSCNTIHF